MSNSLSFQAVRTTSGSANPLCLVTGTVNGKGMFAQSFFPLADGRVRSRSDTNCGDGGDVDFDASVYYYLQDPFPSLIQYPTFPGSNLRTPKAFIPCLPLWSRGR